MKKTSPLSACGEEPSIGVSRWATPRPRAAAWIFCEVSGVTVEQSQVTSPGRAPASTPAPPRQVSSTISSLGSALKSTLACAATSRGAGCTVMPDTAPARLAASGETSCACTVHPAAARLRAMGKPIRPSPMKPTSPFAMRFLPKGELNASGRHASGDLALVHLAVLDLAAPGARLASAALDELLEALEVGLDARAHDTQRIGDVLHDALRLVVHLQHHLRALIVEPMEGDDAGVPGAAA